MTSSLGGQFNALLDTQVTGVGDADDASPNAADAGSKKGSTGADLPAGAHGDVAATVRKVANGRAESLKLSTPLTDCGFGRLSVVELTVRCEEELRVRIEDEDISLFKTLGDVVNYIAARRG